MESVFALLILIAVFSGVTWLVRSLNRASGRRTDEPPPTLTDVLAIEEGALPPPEESTFRQPHVLQVAIYIAATGLLLLALLWSLVAHGWSLLGIILLAAEVLLLFLHGAPLAVNIARSVRLTREGIDTKGLLKKQSISWWEIQSFRVNEDLSGFQAHGLRHSFSFSTSSFKPGVKLAMYSAIRAHLADHQLRMTARAAGRPVVRFLKANALSTLIFVGVAFASVFLAEKSLPEGNVLGLRCAYASDYLRDKYDLPDRHGCVVLRVNNGTGAYRAGLREGDMIVEVEGVPITSGPQFTIYWESLDKHTQKFKIIRPGEVDDVALKVTLGGHGKLPEQDPQDPYFYYLRARGADDMSLALQDFSRAIELDPDFDLAYVYRGSLYSQSRLSDLAFADFEKAIELDPGLAEAYRERAWHNISVLRYEDAAADAEAAIDLDGCHGGFETYNYDCHINHLSLSVAYGERGDAASVLRGVEEAERAMAFYPERPRSYYLAAYYLAALEDFERAQEYAATYVQNAKDFGEPGILIEWAQRLLSGEEIQHEGGGLVSDELEPSALFLENVITSDTDPNGKPSILAVRFAEERTPEPPQEVRYLTPGRNHIWAYFEFDNAAGVFGIQWQWTQNNEVESTGFEEWPGFNKGRAWLRLENRFRDQDSENTLIIGFDGPEGTAANILLRDDPFIGPLSFSTDEEGAQPLLFYAGGPPQVFAHFEYLGALPGSTISWSAEKDGAPITYGNKEVSGAGKLTVPVALPSTLSPGIIDVHVYVGDVLARNAALAVTTPDIAASPPIDSFQIGLGTDGYGGLINVTREISRNAPEVYYAINPLRVPPASTLSIAWFRDGAPYGPPNIVSGSDNYNAVLDLLLGNPLEPGEYRVVITLDTQPVYAEDLVVR